MHVGAVVTEFRAEDGGGFTFEREILLALREIASTSRHAFTVLCPPEALASVSEAVSGSGLNAAALPRRESRLARRANREMEFVRAHWSRPADIDRVASQLGIQFIWFLNAQPDRTDLPYLTVVWDLQHRATPWFPEVSAKGQWDTREAYHRWFLRRATRVVTGTQVGRQQLIDFYQIVPDNILVLPHPTPAFATASQPAVQNHVVERFGLQKPFVLYPAQFWAHKNHVNLVMAIAALARGGHRVGAVLPGSDKGNRPHVEKVAQREGVADLVKFPGFVTQADLLALYREAAALTYVSWCGPENFPPLEAFGLGCPVVASRIPGADEQLGDAVRFCDPGNPDDIAAAIREVLTDEGLQSRLVDAGFRRAKRFTPRDFAIGVLDFLDTFEVIRRCWP